VTSLAERAERLRALHRPGRPLLLPNAWDPPSAAAVAATGFSAVATSSAAVADSIGYRDGQHTPPAQMFAAVARIAAAAGGLPVTADIEAGYGLEAKDLVAELLGTGAVGCNLEDSDPASHQLADPGAQAERLAAVRAAADAAGVPLVINARVDVFLPGRWSTGAGSGAAEPAAAASAAAADHADLLADAIARGRRYLAAGADCVYPILVTDAATVGALVDGIGGPVNAMTFPGAPDIAELAALGVARVSFGSGLHRAMLTWLRTRLDEIAASQQPG
jgi:2-methylisocitrate lyase-like PEP mutase family enzyme